MTKLSAFLQLGSRCYCHPRVPQLVIQLIFGIKSRKSGLWGQIISFGYQVSKNGNTIELVQALGILHILGMELRTRDNFPAFD